MHFARILARKDQAAAEQLLEQGFALAKEVDGDARSLLLSNAISLAAGCRRSTRCLSTEYRRIDPFAGAVLDLVYMMAEHGHIGDPMAQLSDPLPGAAFSLALSSQSPLVVLCVRSGIRINQDPRD